MILDPYRYRSGSTVDQSLNLGQIWAGRLSASTVPVNEKNYNFKCCIGQFFFCQKGAVQVWIRIPDPGKKIGFDQPKAADPQQ